jgi:hypothetical protein
LSLAHHSVAEHVIPAAVVVEVEVTLQSASGPVAGVAAVAWIPLPTRAAAASAVMPTTLQQEQKL